MKTEIYSNYEKNIIRFFNKYECLNKEERREVACYNMRSPYSWNVVYLEIIHRTSLSKQLLAQIIKNNFISQELGSFSEVKK